jgi:hypothetical protein
LKSNAWYPTGDVSKGRIFLPSQGAFGNGRSRREPDIVDRAV